VGGERERERERERSSKRAKQKLGRSLNVDFDVIAYCIAGIPIPVINILPNKQL